MDSVDKYMNEEETEGVDILDKIEVVIDTAKGTTKWRGKKVSEDDETIKQAVKLFYYKDFYNVNPQLDSRLNVKSSLAKIYIKAGQEAFQKLSSKEKKEYHKIKDNFKKYTSKQIKKELEKYLGYSADNDPNDPLDD